MGVEIEKKFLLADDSWKKECAGTIYLQGYLCSAEGKTVRVRIAGHQGYLTIKGKHSGISRLEYEFPIPEEEARSLLNELCDSLIIHKTRYRKEYGGFIWEIDEFYDDNEGLVVAEIELDREDQPFEKPPWIGREVTHDHRYYNVNLRVHPYSLWSDNP